MKIFLLLICALAAIPLLTACGKGPQPPAAGTEAPGFQLPSQEGHNISLRDYLGKWVVLYFYPKDFTSGCTLEAHNFQQDLAKYDALHAVIIGISVDTPDSHKSFCAKEGLNFKLLSDADKKVSAMYGSLNNMGPVSLAARNTFIIDPEGQIAQTFIGVKPATHSADVLAALQELQKK